MEDEDLGVVRSMQKEVACVLKDYKRGHESMFEYRKQMMGVLDELSGRVSELRVATQRARQDLVFA